MKTKSKMKRAKKAAVGRVMYGGRFMGRDPLKLYRSRFSDEERKFLVIDLTSPEEYGAAVEAGAKALWSYYKYEEATSHERSQMSRNWRSVGTGAKDAYRIRAAAFLESLGWPSPSVSAKTVKSGVRK